MKRLVMWALVILAIVGAAIFARVALAPHTPAGDGAAQSTTTPETVSDLISVDSPKADQAAASPLTVTGKARGNWYFEASFPVKLVALNGTVLAQAPAQAQSDWMTTDFVPFKVTLTFDQSDPSLNIQCIRAPCINAHLILKNDNPSGDPARDKSISIPLVIAFISAKPTASACTVSGCSGEICSDTNQVSICIYPPQYACYKTAVCERQASGECGWTQTPALTQCLAENSATTNTLPQ